jgi:hypothetical protein
MRLSHTLLCFLAAPLSALPAVTEVDLQGRWAGTVRSELHPAPGAI